MSNFLLIFANKGIYHISMFANKLIHTNEGSGVGEGGGRDLLKSSNICKCDSIRYANPNHAIFMLTLTSLVIVHCFRLQGDRALPALFSV